MDVTILVEEQVADVIRDNQLCLEAPREHLAARSLSPINILIVPLLDGYHTV